MKRFISIIVTFSIILTMLSAFRGVTFCSELKNIWDRDESIDFSTIPEISPGAEQTVELGEAGKKCVYKFTPAEDGAYKYYSDGPWSYFGAILDSSYRTVAESDNIIIEYGRPSLSGDFGIIYSFKAGETYYLESYIDNYEAGTYKIGLVEVPKATAMEIDFTGYREYGSTLEFTPVFTPVDCEPEIISWSSSNTEVIEVNSDGSAFCKGIGTAIITAETQSGLVAEREIVIEDCEELTIGEKKTFMVLFDIREMYKIVPEVSGTYSFDYEMGDFVWFISSTLYDKDLNVIGKKEMDEADKEFDLVAGNEYYLEIESYSGDVGTDASVLVNLKGASVEPTYPSLTDEPSVVYDLGDANMDGNINSRDALLVLQNAAKLIVLSEKQFELGDVNKDGVADAKDALYILQYAAHIISSFDEISEPSDPTPKPTKVPSGYEIFDSIDVEYDYFNSFVLELSSTENKTFTVEDFPETALSEVWTRGKMKTEEGYLYELVMVIDAEACTEDILAETMNKVKEIEGVLKVGYNDYIEHDTILKLNYSEYMLEVGESVDLTIEDFRPFDLSTNDSCLIVKFNQDTVNGEEISLDTLSKYGIEKLTKGSYIMTGSTATWDNAASDYYIEVYGGWGSEINHTTVAHLLSQLPEVDMIQVVRTTFPTGNRDYENWECSDETIASMVLSGGEESTAATTKLNQTATITALAPGEVTVSVTKGGWGNAEGTGTCVIKVVEKEEQEYVTDVNYDNTRVFSTTGSANEPYIGLDLPDIRVISDYAEYKEYITNAKECLKSVNDNLEIDMYSEDFFIDNSVVVIDYDIGDYATKVYFSNVELTEGKYKVNIEHHSSFMQSPMLRHWEIMIPIEGKECTAEDFEVDFINECEWYCIDNDCGKAAPIVSESGQEYLEYPLVLSTYEEYQEYMALFKEANPNYAVEREYAEEDFESMKLVVGGFWAFSGQLDLKYSGIRTREDELIIDFEGTCPSPHTDDSYYYHYMLACDILDVSQYDVRCNIDVEYYE